MKGFLLSARGVALCIKGMKPNLTGGEHNFGLRLVASTVACRFAAS
jgi:hypothetical protein